MRLEKRVLALFLTAVMAVGMMAVPAFAADYTPCYLFEDFEATDFINKTANNTVPTHQNGTSEYFRASEDVDAKFSIETENLTGGGTNSFLRYQSLGTGTWNTTLELISDNVKNHAAIYDYTVSYDMTIDDWSHVDANGNVLNHSSRFLSIWHGSEGTACAKLTGGYLTASAGNGSDAGVGNNGNIVNLAQLWDTATGKGTTHNLRFVFHKGTGGEGLVDIYVDGACVLQSGQYADSAKPLPTSGCYLGISAYDSYIGALRTSIRFDNIRLEYEGAPASESEGGASKTLQVFNARLTTEETAGDNDSLNFAHQLTFRVTNRGTQPKNLLVIVAGYDANGVMTHCNVVPQTVPVGETVDGTGSLLSSMSVTAGNGYRAQGYVYDTDLIPQCGVVAMEKTELDLALMELEALYDSETMLSWLASLYDTETGGMYYATSSKQNPHLFGPHIESTYGGMYSAIRYLNADAKRALGEWVQSCQDEASGYFVEPEFSINSVNQSKKGRDLGYAKGLLAACGMSPLYLTPDQRAAATAEVDEPQLMASDGTLTGSLGSWEDWKSYLDSLNWSDGSVWGTCHSLESNAGLIVQAGYKKKTAEYIAAKVNPQTGMLGQGLSYNTMSGSLKALWAFGTDSIPYPYVDKMFENALTLAKQEAPGDMAQLINLPVGMQGAKNSYAAAGVDLPASVNRTLKEIIPDLIRVLTKELAKFKKPDGCFGYSKYGGQAYSQGAHVSMGYNESDINGNNALALRVRSVLYEFAGRTATDLLPAAELGRRLNEKWYEAHPVD